MEDGEEQNEEQRGRMRGRHMEERRRKCDLVTTYEVPQEPAVQRRILKVYKQQVACIPTRARSVTSRLRTHSLKNQASNTDVALSLLKLAPGPLMTSL
jgi:hypothetical protein